MYQIINNINCNCHQLYACKSYHDCISHINLQTVHEISYWLIHSFHPCTSTKTTQLANGNFPFHTQHWKDHINKHSLVKHLHKVQKGTNCFIVSLYLTIHMEHFSSHTTDFQEICWVSDFWEYVEKIHITLTWIIVRYTEMYALLW